MRVHFCLYPATPESADEKGNKESDTRYSGADNSSKYAFKSNMLDLENGDLLPQYQHIKNGPTQLNLTIM